MQKIQEYVDDLKIPIRSFRIFALENIIKKATGNEIIEILEALRVQEQDEECKHLFELAISSVNSRNQSISSSKLRDQDEFIANYKAMNTEAKLMALTNLSGKLISNTAKHAPNWFNSEDNALVKASILRTFKNVWPVEFLNPLLKSLSSRSLSVRLATIELLVLKSPAKLQKFLPSLLIHADPRIRSLGIHGLISIDETEAIAHLAKMLESENSNIILAGLRCSIFFPFEKINFYLLRLVSNSNDLRIIRWVGEFLINNPDPETPYRLSEISSRACNEKKGLVNRIISLVLFNIKRSNQLGKNWEAFEISYQNWRKHLGSTIIEKANIILTEVCDESITSNIEQLSVVNESNITKALDKELMPATSTLEKTTIENILQDFNNFSVKEKVSAINSANIQGFTEFISLISPLLKSKETEIIIASIIFLGKYDFENNSIMFNKLLASKNTEVTYIILKVIYQHDPNQALSSLKAIYRRISIEKKKDIFVYFNIFEFLQTRDFLLEIARKSNDFCVLELVMNIFEMNPHKDSLYVLYTLGKELETKVGAKLISEIEMVKQRILRYLISHNLMKPISMKELEQSFEHIYRKEIKGRMEQKPYSVKNLYPEKKTSFSQFISLAEETFEGILNRLPFAYSNQKLQFYKVFAFTTLVLLVVICLFSFSHFTSPSNQKLPTNLTTERKSSTKPINIKGVVLKATPESIKIKDAQGKLYILLPPQGIKIFPIATGVKIRADINIFNNQKKNIVEGMFINLMID